MYELYYGFDEKPFSLTPDPKYLYRSQSHASAFDLLQYAVRRREGFAVVTGDIGTGKTTLCRALLEQIDRTTYTALVLNPFLTEEDLLKRILQDFGVVSRDEARPGRLAHVSKPELIDTLYAILLSLIAIKASVVFSIREAPSLPLLRAYSGRAKRITPEMVAHAAKSLDVPETSVRPLAWLKPNASLGAAAALVLLASAVAVATTAFVYQRFDASVSAAAAEIRSPERLALLRPASGAAAIHEGARGFHPTGTAPSSAAPRVDRHLPAGATLTVLVSSFPLAESSTTADIAALTEWLESSGFPVFYAEVDLGSRGRWQRVLAGAYTDPEIARRDTDRLRSAVPKSEARIVSAGFAAGLMDTEP